ncbi:hypothetical protein ACIO8F_08040 [Streptomyces sp. NPDC087228]|uniref:hypothetical protein n=1 Tax=Streptomyces sp. NPDC087228 TaxID=3365772 RepID=UPI003819C4B1
MTRPPLTVAELRATITATIDTAPTTAASAMQASMMRALVALLDDALAEHGETDSTLDNSGLLALAQGYARALDPEQRDQLAAGIATRLSVDEAGVILRAANAVRTAVPGIVLRAKANGDTTAEIARELDMTDSYVRRITREHRLASWRLDLYDSAAGPGWQPHEAGDDVMPKTHPFPDLAEHILTAAGRGPREYRARVLIWEGLDEQPDDLPVYVHEQDPPSLLDQARGEVEGLLAEFEQGQKAERRRIAAERGTQADPEDYEDDGTGGHDWHHPTPLAGLVCRRCDLAHKNWAGEACPTAS